MRHDGRGGEVVRRREGYALPALPPQRLSVPGSPRRAHEATANADAGDLAGAPKPLLWRSSTSFLDSLVAFTAENLDLLYGGHEPLCGADRLERFSHPAYDWRRSTVLGLLRTAVREGDVDGGLDLEYLASALLAPLDVDFYYYQHRVQGLPVQRISRGVRALVPRAG